MKELLNQKAAKVLLSLLKIKTFIFLSIVSFSLNVNGQWINPSIDSVIYREKLIEIDIFNFNKDYLSSSYGKICTCDLLFKNTDTSIYVVKYYFRKDEDLLFFELKYKSGKTVNGYFRKTIQYCDGDKILCWVQDLIWHYFDIDKKIENVEIYSHGARYPTLLR